MVTAWPTLSRVQRITCLLGGPKLRLANAQRYLHPVLSHRLIDVIPILGTPQQGFLVLQLVLVTPSNSHDITGNVGLDCEEVLLLQTLTRSGLMGAADPLPAHLCRTYLHHWTAFLALLSALLRLASAQGHNGALIDSM